MSKTATELFYECSTEMLRIVESDETLTRREVKEIHDSAMTVMLYAKARLEGMKREEAQHDPAL